jgi:hypothetical protein
MTAKRLSILLLFVAAAATAQMTRHRGAMPTPGTDPLRMFSPAMVTGTVSSVSGNIISVANGTVTLDATGATIVDIGGKPVPLTSLTAGTLLVATVKSDNVAPNAPIPATRVAVSKPADVTLTGPVTAVDVAHNSLTLLGRTIQVTPQTSFGAPMPGIVVNGLTGIEPNELVVVQANPSGQSLVAVSVLVMSMTIDHPELIRGTVKSIAADNWVISGHDNDATVAVNAQTQIVGNPKVGDTVDVLARTDSSGKLVAIAIMKSMMPIFQLPH